MKCSICKSRIEEIFLGKIRGTYIKLNGKQYIVCSECQRKLKTKEELEKALVA